MTSCIRNTTKPKSDIASLKTLSKEDLALVFWLTVNGIQKNIMTGKRNKLIESLIGINVTLSHLLQKFFKGTNEQNIT